MHIDELLTAAVKAGASDLHLKVNNFPIMRLSDTLVPVADASRLEKADLEKMAATVMKPAHREKFAEAQEVDLAPGLGRFRGNVFQQRGTFALALRIVPLRVPSLDELNLPQVLERIAMEPRGLVLMTGTTGSGKSTTLSAMVDHINRHRSAHILTVEDPIEHVHRDDRCIVNNREVAVDAAPSLTPFEAPCGRIPM